jgi:hypothetical protein
MVSTPPFIFNQKHIHLNPNNFYTIFVRVPPLRNFVHVAFPEPVPHQYQVIAGVGGVRFQQTVYPVCSLKLLKLPGSMYILQVEKN